MKKDAEFSSLEISRKSTLESKEDFEIAKDPPNSGLLLDSTEP